MMDMYKLLPQHCGSKFPQTCKHLNSLKNDINASDGIFSHNWDPSYVIKLHFEFFEGSTREISLWKYP